jgi:membrane-associated phospholipid phosphatase
LRAHTRFLAGLLTAAIAMMMLGPVPQAHSQDSEKEVAPAAPSATSDSKKPLTDSGQPETSSTVSSRKKFLGGAVTDFMQDQKQIWTSPAHIRLADAPWLVPLAGITAGLFVTDRQYSASLSTNPTTLSHYKTISNIGIASLAGAGAGMYLMSFPTHNEHWRETGFLAGEAALDSLVTTEVLKYSLGRERPYQGNGSGPFFSGGTSFPSEHAAAAWSIAGVIAHEYPGPLPALFAYGMASAVSFSRVRGRQHFPSDVFVGSLLGYLTAQSVYSRRHDAELGGGSWASPREYVSESMTRKPSFMGSPYVPLNSWIYPALERLAAMGYVKTASLGIRPWTRLECSRLLGEAAELQPETDAPLEVEQLYSALSKEFAYDSELVSGEHNRSAQLESVYSRALGISGTPLTDNEHFGQTLLNDYGRPYEQGFNAVAGASGWSTLGPFVVYVNGEYQSAPSAPSPSPAALDFITAVDGLPSNPPPQPVAAISRFQLLDAYVGMDLANWQLSYGRRSLWWGPSEGGTMIFTNNAAPLSHMFSIDRVSPFRLPWIFGYLGDIRLSAFIGQLSGQEFLVTNFTGPTHGATIGQYGKALHPQPYLSGEKISFKLTQNFEFGMSKTTIYGGPTNPLTLKTFYQSTLGLHVNGDPLGDGRTTSDFSYRIPKLRDWLTFYGEAFSEDEPNPIPYMRKSVFQGGLYFAKLPEVPKLDLRLEGGTTSPVQGTFCTSCFYSNGQYVNGYTNGGNLIGTWIGRAAQGELVQSNYWMSPRKKIGFEFRHRKIDRQYLPQGGTQNDVAVNADIFTGRGFRFSVNLQYERWQIPMLAPNHQNWQIPLLAPNHQNNVAASFEFGFWPTAHAH